MNPHPISRSLDSSLHEFDLYGTHFYAFCWPIFDICGQFACVHIMHVSPSATGEVVEFEKIIFLLSHPISRLLDSNLHEFEFLSTSISHILMLFVGLFLPFWPFCMCAHCVCTPKSHTKVS